MRAPATRTVCVVAFEASARAAQGGDLMWWWTCQTCEQSFTGAMCLRRKVLCNPLGLPLCNPLGVLPAARRCPRPGVNVVGGPAKVQLVWRARERGCVAIAHAPNTHAIALSILTTLTPGCQVRPRRANKDAHAGPRATPGRGQHLGSQHFASRLANAWWPQVCDRAAQGPEGLAARLPTWRAPSCTKANTRRRRRHSARCLR